MRREPGWTSVAVWLVLLALALVCGVAVIGQAFDTGVLAMTSRSLRYSADYSAEPRAVRVQQIAPVDSAVIGDTVKDLVAEQVQASLLDFARTPVAIPPRPRPQRSPLAAPTRT